MANSIWFVDELRDISEFAKGEKLEGVMEGLAAVLETFAVEAGVSVDQHNEILTLLGENRTSKTPFLDVGPL